MCGHYLWGIIALVNLQRRKMAHRRSRENDDYDAEDVRVRKISTFYHYYKELNAICGRKPWLQSQKKTNTLAEHRKLRSEIFELLKLCPSLEKRSLVLYHFLDANNAESLRMLNKYHPEAFAPSPMVWKDGLPPLHYAAFKKRNESIACLVELFPDFCREICFEANGQKRLPIQTYLEHAGQPSTQTARLLMKHLDLQVLQTCPNLVEFAVNSGKANAQILRAITSLLELHQISVSDLSFRLKPNKIRDDTVAFLETCLLPSTKHICWTCPKREAFPKSQNAKHNLFRILSKLGEAPSESPSSLKIVELHFTDDLDSRAEDGFKNLLKNRKGLESMILRGGCNMLRCLLGIMEEFQTPKNLELVFTDNFSIIPPRILLGLLECPNMAQSVTLDNIKSPEAMMPTTFMCSTIEKLRLKNFEAPAETWSTLLQGLIRLEDIAICSIKVATQPLTSVISRALLTKHRSRLRRINLKYPLNQADVDEIKNTLLKNDQNTECPAVLSSLKCQGNANVTWIQHWLSLNRLRCRDLTKHQQNDLLDMLELCNNFASKSEGFDYTYIILKQTVSSWQPEGKLLLGQSADGSQTICP